MTNPTNEFAGLLHTFFREHLIHQRRASVHTVKSYRDMWKMLLQFLAQSQKKRPSQCSLDDLTAETILAFLDDLQVSRQCSERTRNQRLAAIRAFFHYASLRYPERLDQFRRILQISFRRCEQRVLGSLTHEEMDAMLSVPDRESAIGRRHAILILFLYNTGARVQEATDLTVEQIRFETPADVRLLGKGSKERIVPLWDDTAQHLAEQIAEQGSSELPKSPVFVNRRGERLTRGGVAHIVEETRKKASIRCATLKHKSVSPHTMRHTTAMHLLQSGVDLNMIRCWLGHVSCDTTHQYVDADLDMKREALAKGGITGLPGGRTRWKPTEDILSFLESL